MTAEHRFQILPTHMDPNKCLVMRGQAIVGMAWRANGTITQDNLVKKLTREDVVSIQADLAKWASHG